jgi:thiamine biosynthesis lipoprotein
MTAAWRVARTQADQPDDWAAWLAKHGPGHTRLSQRPGQVRLVAPIPWLDFGGIGKGYAADEALATLKARGIEAALVDLGGDLAIGAAPPGTQGWSVARGGADANEPLLLARCGVATSGVGEQHLATDERFVSHVIDPRTGQWIGHHDDITVVAPTAAKADALASAGCVLGAAALRHCVANEIGVTVY